MNTITLSQLQTAIACAIHTDDWRDKVPSGIDTCLKQELTPFAYRLSQRIRDTIDLHLNLHFALKGIPKELHDYICDGSKYTNSHYGEFFGLDFALVKFLGSFQAPRLVLALESESNPDNAFTTAADSVPDFCKLLMFRAESIMYIGVLSHKTSPGLNAVSFSKHLLRSWCASARGSCTGFGAALWFCDSFPHNPTLIHIDASSHSSIATVSKYEATNRVWRDVLNDSTD